MKLPDWRTLKLMEGIAPEVTEDDNRIVLWLPVKEPIKSACWERIATVARAEIRDEQGICAVAATSIRARRAGFFSGLGRRLGLDSSTQVWTLPNGQSAEQVGGRRTDLCLAWSEGAGIDEACVRSRWPKNEVFQKLAGN